MQGRSFEQLMAWWLVNDPEQGAHYERVDKPDRDVGVDLRAHPFGGGRPTAVQCKQWTGDIPKSEIDSFLAAAATDEYDGSLLIHTGSGFSRNARDTITAQKSPCVVVDLSTLLRSDVQWPTDLQHLGTGGPLPPRKPGPHQTSAHEQICFELTRPGRSRTWIDLACGSGKTLVGVTVADALAPTLAAVLVQQTADLHRVARAWRRDARLEFSELRVTSIQESAAANLEDLQAPRATTTTTSQARIAEFLSGGDRRVVFCTYASAERLAAAVREAGVTIDLLIADDAHTIASQRDSTRVRAVLDDDVLPARLRLFMTATPRIWEPQALEAARRHRSPLVDMRSSATGDFGVRAFHLSHRAAFEQGIVLPFDVHVVEVTTEEVHRIIASGRLVATARQTKAVIASLAATQIAVAKAASDLALNRIVAFHSRIDDSRLFASTFAATAAITDGTDPDRVPAARHVDYRSPSERRQAITWFESTPGPCLLSNVKLLAEGVDSPDIDAIIWNDPNASPITIIQAVGRALRPWPGKHRATVIVPMVIGPDGNVAKVRDHSTFAPTLRILDALRTIDPEFTLTRESLRFYAAKHRNTSASRSVPSDDLVAAPLIVTETFAAAINHRYVPDATDAADDAAALPVTPRPRHHEATPRPSPTRPAAKTFDSGLDHLVAISRDKLLFSLDDPAGRHWLALLRDRFDRRGVSAVELQLIAGHLSFLAEGLGSAMSDLRRALARSADRDVVEQAAQWFRRKRPASSPLYVLSETARREGWELNETIARLCSRLTHKGMSAVEQVKLCAGPLRIAASGLGHQEDPSSRLAGVIAGLNYPWDETPPSTPDSWRPDAPTDAGRADWATYEAGWEASTPWRAQARLIQRLTPELHEEGIAWAAAIDTDRQTRDRWDYTTWVVYIQMLGRGEDRHIAARKAGLMRYPARRQRAAALLSPTSAQRAA
jgi:superfamily II DNA or RNA helicase